MAVSLVSLGGGELGELLNYWKQIARTLGGPRYNAKSEREEEPLSGMGLRVPRSGGEGRETGGGGGGGSRHTVDTVAHIKESS